MEEVVDRSLVVDDIETLAGIFTYTDYNIDTKEIYQFIIHPSKNELLEFVNYLQTVRGQITFNGNNFDYPVLHYILNNYKDWIKFNLSTEKIIDLIYQEAQRLINTQNNSFKTGQKTYSLQESKFLIPQLDLFRIWHYDNAARRTSLKALEVSMNYPNVQEMPIDHSTKDISQEDIKMILEYNLNDVMATYEFYLKTVQFGKIELRKGLVKKYGLPCLNWNNGKIGEQLLLKLYCQKTGLNPYDVKQLRSPRVSVDLKDCVPNNISFKTKEFNALLDFFNNKTIYNTKGSINYSVIYKLLKYVYGTGGLHAAIKSGVYESDEEYIIKSCDVASLYPNLPIVYKFWIEHLGPEFLEVYRDDIVAVRLAEKAKGKDGDKSIVDGFKECANIPYGKSNEEFSFLYDPLYSMKTTIAGQLVLSVLAERLSNIPDSQMLMCNTDGVEIRIPKTYESLYNQICEDWQKEFNLILEFADYKKMWIGDVNNYGCVTTTGKIKNKGRFEVDKVIGSEPAYHKDNSFRVIPLAIQEYFINGTSIEDTIRNHTNIYDFCGRQKFQINSFGEICFLAPDNNELIKKKTQKVTRYYLSTQGDTFIKNYVNDLNKVTDIEFIHKGYKVQIFNKFVDLPFNEYNINYSWYIKEANNMLQQIEDKQLELF